MTFAGLAVSYIELIFWAYFVFIVLKDPYSIDYLSPDMRNLLKEQSDYFHLLAIVMVLSGLLWIVGVYKVNIN